MESQVESKRRSIKPDYDPLMGTTDDMEGSSSSTNSSSNIPFSQLPSRPFQSLLPEVPTLPPLPQKSTSSSTTTTKTTPTSEPSISISNKTNTITNDVLNQSELDNQLAVESDQTEPDPHQMDVEEQYDITDQKIDPNDTTTTTANSTTTTTTTTNVDIEDLEDGEVPSEARIFSDWLIKEEKLSKSNWLPQRDLVAQEALEDEDNEEDPERVVFFQDIKDILFQATYPDLKIELVYMYLHFLGLKVPRRHSSQSEFYIEFLERIQNVDNYLKIFELLSLVNKEGQTKDKLNIDFSKFDSLDRIEDDPTAVTMIRNTLNSVLKKLPSNLKDEKIKLNMLLIEFEAAQGNLETSKTIAKSLLQTDSNNLQLWYTYAKTEQNAGNIKESMRVYQKAITHSKSLTEKAKKDIPLLIRAYAELIYLRGESNWEDEALNVLLSLIEPELVTKKKGTQKVPQTRILKGRKGYFDYFVKIREEMNDKSSTTTSTIQPSIFTHFSYCYILFEYLSSGLDKAESVYKSTIQVMKEYTGSSEQFGTSFATYEEQLTEAYSVLIYKHSRRILSTPPSVLRNILTEAMKSWPLNHVLISLYIENEEKSKIAGRLRLHFDTVCPKVGSVLLWMFSVKSENQAGSYRIKNVFERALKETSSTKRAALLWHNYLLFEISKQNWEEAKNLFYRAIRSVPWYKPIWLECVRSLLPAFDNVEVQDLIRLMAEKELRLHSTPS
eukprot:TRINITY_DN2182_c3_g1_i5.p1 TRINITY_DN2182_c3_g1~~TRINITY_DN2182_c3_g1_i5.p1  ORF type:complete len:724 (-),score=193.33 TRINITY_DN2182_c3_g1_i5:1827-3998(-)